PHPSPLTHHSWGISPTRGTFARSTVTRLLCASGRGKGATHKYLSFCARRTAHAARRVPRQKARSQVRTDLQHEPNRKAWHASQSRRLQHGEPAAGSESRRLDGEANGKLIYVLLQRSVSLLPY